MNLTSVVLGFAIESVVLVAIGNAMLLGGVREFPSWVSGDMVLIAVVLYVTVHAIAMTFAIIGKPVSAPRLPNLAQTVRHQVFPEPPTHRSRRTAYAARQRAVRP